MWLTVASFGAIISSKVASAANSVLSVSAALVVDIAKTGEMVVTTVKGSRKFFHVKKDLVAKNVNMAN